jgi:uncharacterized membrane-anchored protein
MTMVNRVFTWLQDRQRNVLLASVSLQLIVLLGLVAVNAAPLLVGDNVMLRVVPVDPRDLLRGDYVILGYEFSRVEPGQLAGLPNETNCDGDRSEWKNRVVYVSLVREPGGEHWEAEKFSFQRPQRGKFIRGRMIHYGRLNFDIEQYFVQEGTGRKYERAIHGGGVSAVVAIDSDGRAKLRQLRIN